MRDQVRLITYVDGSPVTSRACASCCRGHSRGSSAVCTRCSVPVVQRLVLIRLRNTQRAFGGDWTLVEEGRDEGRISMRWDQDTDVAALKADLRARTHAVTLTVDGVERTHTDLAAVPV